MKHPLFGEVSKNFNETEALRVYEGFLADPDYYRVLLNMHAYEVVNKTILEQPEIIDALIIDKYNARKELVKEAVLSGIVNKTMTNSAVDEVVATMDLIAKSMDDYTSFERAANVKQQTRGQGGRFVKMGSTRIDVPQGATGPRGRDRHQGGFWNEQTRAYDTVTTRKHGVTPPRVTQSAALNTAHSAAYLQVADAIHQMDPTDMMMADIHYVKQNDDGSVGQGFRRTKVGSTVNDFISADEYGSGEIPTKINWYMDSESSGYGKFDILTGAGASTETAFDVANAAGRSGPALGQMNQTLGAEYTGERGGQKYGQLGAVASMIETVGGDRISPQGKAALSAAKYVGEHGSEAEKVLGPTARRAAYRYRGTEMKPDPKMDKAIAASVAGSKDVNDAHERLIHPVQVTAVEETKGTDWEGNPTVTNGLDFESENEHSPFIRYWQSQLPSKKYIKLHLDSGTTPPSQGVVFDAKGQIITQSVGYGDDHYLPFNLNKLTGANRGEWVRTRTMGGPTTEDISAALLTGTRAVTVVSHSGEYVVEFDDSFRGGRRNNDKNRRMIRRYAQLLDTLDAENTTLQGIPSDRRRELEDRVKAEIPGMDTRAQQNRSDRLKEMEAVERANPQPSQREREKWMEEFGEKFSESLAENSNRDEMSWKDVKSNFRIKEQREQDIAFDAKIARANPWERREMENSRPEKIGELSDAEVLERLGATKSFERFTQRKEAEYKAEQAPLKLNGQGYYFALQALQEQFPNAIKRVEWYPATDDMTKDTGYVPHKFNRPSAAKEGFWNPEIEGVSSTQIKNSRGQATGKVAAHRTNYQNYAARQRVGTPAQGGAPATPLTATAAQAQGAARTAPRVSPVTGVLFNNMTPDPAVNSRSSVSVERRRAAMDASQLLANIGITTMVNGQQQSVPLGRANLQGLPTLSRVGMPNAVDLNDDATLDRLADEIQGVYNGNIQVEGGNAGPLLSQIMANRNGQAVEQAHGAALGSNQVKPLASIKAAFADPNAVWDFSAPGVDGANFLPGGNRTHHDYETTLNSDPDIQSIRREFLAQNDDWDAFSRDKIATITSRSRDQGDVAAQNYRGGATIEYAGVDYTAGSEELSTRLQNDALGILKTKQLQRYLGPHLSGNPFPRPQTQPAITGSP